MRLSFNKPGFDCSFKTIAYCEGEAVNPASPNIHIQILQTDLQTFP